MANNQATGLAGERGAEAFLQKKGYKILSRNYRKKTGEIDLVAKDGEYIVFIEVKARKGLEYGYPREAVGYMKQKRIINTALQYIAQYKLTDVGIRFDVIEVLINNGEIYISHVENAFTA